jgi:hypothetical protein
MNELSCALTKVLHRSFRWLTLAAFVTVGQAQQPVPSATPSQPPASHVSVAAPAPAAPGLSCSDQESRIVGDGSSPPNTFALSQFADTCLGVEGDPNPFTVSTRKAFGSPPSAQHIGSALQIITKQVTDNPGLYVPDSVRQSVLAQLSQISQAVDAVVISGTGPTSPPNWKVSGVDHPPSLPDLHISGSLATACRPDPKSNACAAALASAKNWYRLIHLVEGTLTFYTAHSLEFRQAESKRRLDMWHAYRDEALPQFPWEWALNSWYIAQHSPRERDTNKQPIGPPPLPTTQLVFLHPGTGVEWRDGVRNGSKAQPSLYLEVAGFYHWTWDESTGAMQGARGVSAIMSYTHRQNETKLGYGLLFHWRKSAQLKPFSLAVTKSGGNTSILLNVDFAEYFKEQLSDQTANPEAVSTTP